MIIDCISDLHGYYPELEGGDLLIVAGDLTARDEGMEYIDFLEWLVLKTNYRKKIIIAGNHDNLIQKYRIKIPSGYGEGFLTEYLCDSGTEFEGLKIWGSPWTAWFHGVHPNCKAFMLKEKELEKKWALIPEDTDILVTHGPPHGILDEVKKHNSFGFSNSENDGYENVGSKSLQSLLYGEKIKPKLHVFGHIHEGYGIIEKMLDYPHTKFINASHVNEDYEPVNKPIRVIL